MKKIILLSLVLALGACGEDTEAEDVRSSSASPQTSPQASTSTPAGQTSSPAKASKGKVSFQALSKETVEKHGGIISECHISFKVTNNLGANIERACLQYNLVTNESGAYGAATKVMGTQKVCGRDMKKRARETVVEEISTAGCSEISALQIVGFECFDDDKTCNAGAYTIDGNNIITVRN